MAKLSAYGRSVVAQLKKQIPDQSELTVGRWVVYSIMSNGDIMKKDQVRFRPDQYRPNGELHDWGWHKYARLKTTADVNTFINRCVSEKGFTRIA